MAEIKAKAGGGTGPTAVLDAVDVVGEVEAEGRLRTILLPALLPAEGALLVAGQPLLPGVVDPHDHQVVNPGQGQQVGEGRPMPAGADRQCYTRSFVVGLQKEL